jgi:hypothetical protein
MRDTDIVLTFAGCDCRLRIGRYPAGGAVALQLVSECGREPIATATVNVPEIDVPPGLVLIKDYSENEGMLASLTKAGVVQPTGRTVPVGYCHAHVCRLLIHAPEQREVQ